MKHILFVTLVALFLEAGATGCVKTSTARFYGIVPSLSDGKTITLSSKDIQKVRIALEGEYDWTGSFSDQTMFQFESEGPLYGKGFQAYTWWFRIVKPGQTTLTVSGEPKCRKNTPPCDTPSISHKVEIVIE